MDYKKLSAEMAAIVEHYRVHGPQAILTKSTLVPMSASSKPGAPPLVQAFVRSHKGMMVRTNELKAEGIVMHEASGLIHTAQIPLDKVERLAGDPAVERISPAKQLRPLLDVAANKTHIPQFKAQKSFTGKGVIVGIVDSGIDTSHPMFGGRILSIWDQTIPGVGWGTTNYGTVLTGATLPVSGDQNGHGTHVAGIAAGDNPRYEGLATKADLIVVKTNFQNTGIADGIRYIFSQAQEMSRPAVINLSLGGHGDAHDGTDDLSEVIDQESGTGRIVVVAAGNEGDDAIHGTLSVAPGQAGQMEFRVTPTTRPGAAPWAVLNGWYRGDVECEISVQTSAGETTPPQSVIHMGAPTRSYNPVGAQIQLTTQPATVNPNGDHQFLIELSPAAFSSRLQGGTWRLMIKNTGAQPCRVDVWSIVPEGAAPIVFLGDAVDPDMKIGSPGCAAAAVTVAAYTTRNTWTTATGASPCVGLPIDDICDFSSPGPLRNGAQKPDVTAPGAMIISALSGQSYPDARYIVDQHFWVNAGTSMASPFIAGLIALLLEGDATLDHKGAKAQLRAHCMIPAQRAGTWSSKWGYGLIDASTL